MKLFDFLITKLTLCLILGILIGYYIPISIWWNFGVFIVLFLLSCLFFWKAQQHFLQKIHFGLFAMLTAVSLGILIENVHQEKNHSTHYSQFLTEQSETQQCTIQIREVLKSTKYSDRYIGEFLWLNDIPVSGKILIHLQKDSLSKPLQVDQIVHVHSTLQEVLPALNPTTFDYQTYLNDRYIYHQLQLRNDTFLVNDTPKKTMLGYAATFRNTVHQNLQNNGFQQDELAVIEALLLGQRQHISKELQTQYANAGAIHILAISGLHIGIIVVLLNFLLKPLTRIRYGTLVKLVLLLLVLWSFAIVSGLSASVVRAVAMFTAIVVATSFNRQTNTFQVLVISMFFLVLCKPHFLFDVGFQLSYAAVFAIVWLQPLWKQLWHPNAWILKSFWNLLTVSLSAQLGVLPLSLYYFHQFPGLFFVANLTIIPVLGIILILGIFVILLSYFEILPEIVSSFYSFVIEKMNLFIAWIASHEQFLFTNIFISALQLTGCYLVFISFTHYFHVKKRKQLRIALFSILACQILWFADRLQHYPNADKFTIFHQSKTSVLAHQQATDLQLFHELDTVAFAKNYTMQQQTSQRFLTSISNDRLKNVYQLQEDYLLRIDSSGIYKSLGFSPKYVLLTQSPKINFERMLQTLQPELVIADGSNYKRYVARWKKVAAKQKIPFHATAEKGFLTIDLDQ